MIYILESKVITTKHGYVGQVTAWELVSTEIGGKLPLRRYKKLWSMKTDIVRLSKPEALADAIILKNSIESKNEHFYAI